MVIPIWALRVEKGVKHSFFFLAILLYIRTITPEETSKEKRGGAVVRCDSQQKMS